MKVSERFALNEWLTDYPNDKTYDEVCDLLRDEDESVTVWQWFEQIPVEDIIWSIDSTREHFENVTKEIIR